jgi:PIN domain nuclease of toxin-antitoxin system
LKLLLDTHAVLWFLSGDDRLDENAARHITDEANRVILSAAVVWEIAIKRSLEKLVVPREYRSLLLDGGAQPLAVTVYHAAEVKRLPWHHRDPFDRILVAQATVEGAAIVSRDERLRPYGIPLVW